jgi:Tol biopolymer transport system component
VSAAVAGAALTVPVLALAGITGPTELISIGPDGVNPVTARGAASVDASGRYVAFSSAGRDLDPSETNPHEDVFVRDRQTGAFERVSLSVAGQDANGPSTTTPWSLSADASRVAFASKATNLVTSDNNLREDVFVRDRGAGTTQLVSSNFAHLDANGSASEPALSADGSTVAFTSDATDMTVVPDLDGKRDVYVRDLASGSTTRVSETPSGAPANGPSSQPVISADGSRVAFVSSATDLVPNDTNGKPDVFVRDLPSGQTTRVSVGNGGAQANNESTDPFISPDGTLVGFSTLASNLGGRKFTGATSYELYLRDLGTSRTERLSMRVGPFEGAQVSRELGDGTNRHGAISADNRLVAFDSTSTGYVSSDSGNSDVFVLDRATDRVAILSRTPSNTTANGSSYQPAISAGGVAFRSSATNLASPGGAFNLQVFFRPYEADAVPADIDGDGFANIPDVCPTEADPGQEDADGEGRGDACDIDDDSDSLLDPFEPEQDSDRTKADTDGDGYDDVRDDYPNDPPGGPFRTTGTDHQRLNIAQLDSAEGEALAKFFWDNATKRFEVRVTGALKKKTSYTTVVYRRHPAIRLQTVCIGTTDDLGALQCVKKGQALNWFTHVELRRGSTVLATAVCDDPDQVVGERRCDVLE